MAALFICTLLVTANLCAQARFPRTRAECESDAPEGCTCFEWFGISNLGNVDHEDVKQMYRGFALHAHPDKKPPSEKSKWEAIFAFGQSCKEFLRQDGNLKAYIARVKSKLNMANKKSWSDSKFAENIEELHIEFGIGSTSREGTETPRFQKREAPTEKMHLFLDDSASMQGDKLEEAKQVIEEIMPRLERTPTTVHLIGTRRHSQQIYSETDDFVFDDVSSRWRAPVQFVESCDVLFMMDITGSMMSAITSARQKVVELAEGLSARMRTVRLAFVGYRDMGDAQEFSLLDFTHEPSVIRQHLFATSASGGGDTPENVIGALEHALESSWQAEQKILIHIADAPGHLPRRGQRSSADILQDMAKLGIEYTMLLIGSSPMDMAAEYTRIYQYFGAAMKVMTVHACTPDLFKQTVMDAAFEATPHARGTFLWQYVYQVIKKTHGRDQEVIIVTDGYDNDSDDDFRGTNGFNHLMQLLKDAGIALPRIIVYCIGNEDCVKARYRELAMASGGGFFMSSAPCARDAFVKHALLTHAERVTKALKQKEKYAQLTDSANRFQWFAPALADSSAASDGPGVGLSCKSVGGAQVCQRKRRQ